MKLEKSPIPFYQYEEPIIDSEMISELFTPITTYSDQLYVILIAENGGSPMSNCFISKAEKAREYITREYQDLKKNIKIDDFKRRICILKLKENMEFNCDVYMQQGDLTFDELI